MDRPYNDLKSLRVLVESHRDGSQFAMDDSGIMRILDYVEYLENMDEKQTDRIFRLFDMIERLFDKLSNREIIRK